MRSFLASCLFALVTASGWSAGDPLASLRPGHPRLLLTDEALARGIAAAKSDPLRAAVHARIIELAETQLTAPPVEHVLIGPRLLDKSRTALDRVLTGAMAYRLTHDSRFAARAKREMLTVAAFADWNSSHFLDVAEMSTALALGYDWLFDYLTPEERATIRGALIDKGLSFATTAYSPAGRQDRRFSFVMVHHNWNQVCNGGLMLAALALADEEPALARTVIAGARESLPRSMAAYQPDGAFPEGPGYWNYGTSYNVLLLAALESALGTDFGLGRIPGIDRTAGYRLQVQSPTGLGFNYADGGPGLNATPAYTWLAQRYGPAAAVAHGRALLAESVAHKSKDQETDRFFALYALWFPEPGAPFSAPLDARFDGPAQLAFFRSAWDDPRALFLGFKAGSNTVNHAHLDLGSFVLDADGVRWAEDLGSDDYNLPDYFRGKRWNYFRLNNRSHNGLNPGDALQSAAATAPLATFQSTPARASATADLTAAYPGTAKKILRGVALLDRARVLVQDEVTGLAAGTPLRWQLVTAARVTIANPHQAELERGGRKLRAEILEPAGAAFSVVPATPPTAEEKQNPNDRILVATVAPAPGPTDSRLVILLTPVGDHWPANLPPPAITPLANW